MAEDYESKLQSEYFKVQELPEFQSISIEWNWKCVTLGE
jgi:hypothetical protein